MTSFEQVAFCVLCGVGLCLASGCGDGDGKEGLDICAEIQCDDGNPCTEDVCDPEDPEVCILFDAPAGTPCEESRVCDGSGACADCNDDEDCPRDFNECTRPACNENTCAGNPVLDGTPCTGGLCIDGQCALRGSVLPCSEQAIRNAVASGGGPYIFECEGPTTLVTESEIVIDNDVILDGRGELTLDGNDDHRVFSVHAQVTVELEGFIVTNGRATRVIDNANCGGLSNAGALTLTRTTVSGNRASSGGGGGICNQGQLKLFESAVIDNAAAACGGIFNNGWSILTNSTVSGNTATRGGGGACNSGTLQLIASTVSGNTASHTGGLESSGTLVVSNSTISGNVSDEGAAGVFNTGTATLEGSTVARNDFTGGLGDIRNAGQLTVAATLLEGGCTTPADEVTSGGYNIESPGDTCGFDNGTDRVNVREDDIQLGLLADNGGPTMTHALLPESVAIDSIPSTECQLDSDQRGAPRPEAGGSMCDIGAFELQ